MIWLPVLGFALVALAAIGFAVAPLWKRRAKGTGLLALAIGAFLLGVGGGTYWMVGRPYLAARAAEGLRTHDVAGLIPYLIQRVRKAPGDLTAWTYLGRAYMTVNDPADAAKAYERAVTVARLSGHPDPELDTLYGETLVAAGGGAVSDDAMAAFEAALARNPKEPVARFFLAQGKAERGDRAGALALWQGLLAEVPAKAPLHQMLVDRIAMLTAAGGGAPDPRKMVAMLAARLKADPGDADGWQRLIRAYSVLGQPADARAALAAARKAFARDKSVMAALDAEAKELKLD